MINRYYLLTLLLSLMALSAAAQTNRIYIEDFEICPDSTVTVPVMLVNEEQSRGLQFNFTLPQGLKLLGNEATQHTDSCNMNTSCNFNKTDSCYVVFMYSLGRNVFPPDTAAVMTLRLKAGINFKGGDLVVWKCRGSTIDNMTIYIDNDTTHVTVPASELIGIPMDQTPKREQYFNLMGQPIDSPAAAPVAIMVTTMPNGSRSSRKITVH